MVFMRRTYRRKVTTGESRGKVTTGESVEDGDDGDRPKRCEGASGALSCKNARPRQGLDRRHGQKIVQNKFCHVPGLNE